MDTCVVSELWRKGGSEKVRKRVAVLKAEDSYLSVLTVFLPHSTYRQSRVILLTFFFLEKSI